jgi:hypothetical protein
LPLLLPHHRSAKLTESVMDQADHFRDIGSGQAISAQVPRRYFGSQGSEVIGGYVDAAVLVHDIRCCSGVSYKYFRNMDS